MQLSILYLLIVCALACSNDNDCEFLHTCSEGSCGHKESWPPHILEIVGYFSLILVSSASSSAGIGGSQIATPLFLFLFNFDIKEALPLSLTVVFGSSVATIALKLPLRHPTRDRPLINYAFVMHCQSSLMLGTTFGVFLYSVFPEWLILSIYLLLLLYLCQKSIRKGLNLYRIEKSLSPADYELDNNEQILISEDLKKIYRQENRIIDVVPFMMIVSIYLLVIAESLLKGDKGVRSMINVEICSTEYWLLTVGFSLAQVLLSLLTGTYLVRKTKEYSALDYNFDMKDVQWDRKKAMVVSVVSFFSGVTAGLLGMGGSILVNVTMLSYDIRPEIVAASTSFMILFSSSFGLILYLIAGALALDYAVVVMCLSAFGSILGVTIVRKMINRTGHSSLIVLILAFILVIALIFVGAYSIFYFLNHGFEESFDTLC